MKRLFLLLLILLVPVSFASCGEIETSVDFVVDGEVYVSIPTEGNESVNMPADPAKEGYVFGGWYFDEGVWENAFTADFLLHNKLSDSITVYAKWTEAHIHTVSDWIVDSEATCKDPGKKHTVCTKCGEVVENAIIEKSEDHTVVVDPAVEPTGTTDGLTEGSHCGTCGKVLVAQTVISSKLQGIDISSSFLIVDGDIITGSCANSTESFSFMNDISVCSSASYTVALDEGFKNIIDSKVATLEIGDNVFYLLVKNGSESKTYTVTIRRLPTYTVSFAATGGTAVRSQTVEEGGLATAPITTRTGYTFKGWNFDFSTPITADLKIEALWEANTDTPYCVEYYLENIYKSGYEYPIVEKFVGTTAATVTAELKTFEHFKFNEEISVTSGSINADGTLVLKVFYLRNTYNADAFIDDDAHGSITGGGTYAYGKEVTLTAIDNPGYIFLGWFDGEFTACRDAAFTFVAEEDVSYTAKWTEDTNTPYTVEYYLQNSKKTGFDAPIIQVLAGTTNAPVVAEQKIFDHFTFLDTKDNVLNGNISPDGKLVLRVYYSRDTYDVTVSVSDVNRGTADGSGNYIYAQEVTLSATDKRGYSFLGWYDKNGNEVMKASDSVRKNDTYPYTYSWTFAAEQSAAYVATWALATNTPYTVEYYLETLDNDYPAIPYKTEFLTGTTFDEVNAEIKDFAHFTFDSGSGSSLSGMVAPDGTLILKVYYTRNTYNVGASVDEEKHGTVTGSGDYAYDKEITLTATSNPGYTFNGWYEGDDKVCEELVYTFNANHSATYTAKWDNATDTKYKVKYYLESYEYDEHNKLKYDLFETLDLIGTTHDEVSAEQKVFEHFKILDTEQNVLSGEIAPDGTLVLKVYYSRNKYSIDNQEGGYITGATGRWFRYEDTVTLTASSYKGHDFIGWYLNGESYSKEACIEFDVIGNLEARFVIKDELKYFELDGTSGEYNITGVKEDYRSETVIVVPSYVTGIKKGAFAGCSNLEKLTIPFIGLGKMSGSTVPKPYPLGIIFGESSYGGSVAVKQTYDNNEHIDVVEETDTTYYLPASLSEVTVIKKDIPLGAFSGCANIKKVTLGENVSTLAAKAFYECKGLEIVDFEGNTQITSVGYRAFYGCESLKSVKMGNAVKTVGEQAFYNCESLESVDLGNAVQALGSKAFYNCASLKTVDLPATVTSISEVFYGCTGLESIVIPNDVTTIEQADFKYCSNLKSVTIGNGVTTIGNRAFGSDIEVGFHGFTKLETLIIGNNVTTIEGYAFYDCKGLTSIVIPNSVESIGVSAFSGCSAVRTLTIGSKVSTIGSYAFAHITNLTSVSIPANVTSMGSYAFTECASLKTVEIGDGIQNIPDGLFSSCTSLESITISANVTTLGTKVSPFKQCTSLKSIEVDEDNSAYISIDGNLYTADGKTLIQYALGKTNEKFTIPAGVTAILSGAFEGASNLKRLAMSEGITKIGDSMFKNCTGIESIALPSTVTEIGASAFEECKSLSSVSLPSNLTVIGANAFKNCTALTQITIPNKVTTIGGYAFNKSGLTSITVPASVTSLGDYAFAECKSLESANIQASIQIGPADLFNWCDKLKTVILPNTLTSIGDRMFYYCKALESIDLPDGLLTIGKLAFSDCVKLEGIDLPDRLLTIETKAFIYCIGLTSITIPDSVTTIGPDAFMECKWLETVHIGRGLSLIGEAGKWANKTTCFRDCWALKNIYVDDANEYFKDDDGVLYAKDSGGRPTVLLQYGMGRIEEDGCYKILDNVTRIGAYAVYTTTNTTLTTLIIPDSVTEMGDYSLSSNIKNIYYEGTEAQWKAISKASSSYSKQSTITYNYTGQ